jgi:pimeloyl-ACP methyl ester carboxylesterase
MRVLSAVKPYVQADFYSEPPDLFALDRVPLVVHRPAETAVRRHLVVFIHGLTGHRYGYWNRTPFFVSKDVASADIGMYYYRTTAERVGPFVSISIEDEARVLANEIHSLEQYDRVVIIAHSLGGVLARCAIAFLMQDNRRRALKRLSGLILLGVPMAGSMRVPFLALLFSRDARALFPHNDLLSRTRRQLSQLDMRYKEGRRRADRIPMWTVSASEDVWVDKFSSSLDVPLEQSSNARATHSELTNPASQDSEVYRDCRKWILLALGTQRSEDSPIAEADIENPRPTDIESIREVASAAFGSPVSDVEIIRELVAIPGIVTVLRESTDVGGEHADIITGYLCVIPLTAAAELQIQNGALRGNQIRAVHVERNWADCHAIYIGAIVGEGHVSRAVVVQALRSYLAEFRAKTQRGDIRLITRPITPDGERLARKHNFDPGPPLPNGDVIWSRSIV